MLEASQLSLIKLDDIEQWLLVKNKKGLLKDPISILKYSSAKIRIRVVVTSTRGYCFQRGNFVIVTLNGTRSDKCCEQPQRNWWYLDKYHHHHNDYGHPWSFSSRRQFDKKFLKRCHEQVSFFMGGGANYHGGSWEMDAFFHFKIKPEKMLIHGRTRKKLLFPSNYNTEHFGQ